MKDKKRYRGKPDCANPTTSLVIRELLIASSFAPNALAMSMAIRESIEVLTMQLWQDEFCIKGVYAV